MELKEFVTQTLVQIVEGVKDAQEQLKDSGALINPMTDTNGIIEIEDGYKSNAINRNVQKIKMDIAVTVSESDGSKKGIGVVASVLKAGASAESSDSYMKTSRIEFEIPVSFPVSN